MMSWAFFKFDKTGIDAQVRKIWPHFYGDQEKTPTGVSTERKEEMERWFAGHLKEFTDTLKGAEATAANVMARYGLDQWKQAYLQTRVYTQDQVIDQLQDIFEKLAVLLLPGMTERLGKIKSQIVGNRETFERICTDPQRRAHDGDLAHDVRRG